MLSVKKKYEDQEKSHVMATTVDVSIKGNKQKASIISVLNHQNLREIFCICQLFCHLTDSSLVSF